MTISKDVQEQIAQLQMIEQHMQQFHLQKQTLQIQLVEIDNALEELGKTKEAPFKVVGNIMVSCKKDVLQKDLVAKKEMCNVRLKNVEQQEAQMKEKMQTLHEQVIKQIEKK